MTAPLASGLDGRHSPFGDPESASNSRASLTAGQSRADRVYQRPRELRAAVVLAIVASVAALPISISHVFGVRTKKHMRDVVTGRIVTMMANAEPLWDGAVHTFPGDPMGQHHAAADLDSPVSTNLAAGSPLPALAGATNVNFPPEPDRYRFFPHISILTQEIGQDGHL